MATVSIIIKSYNEEHNIVRAIESELKALSTIQGEVILADSASTDRTVELAKAYPIKIVSLNNPSERCCGIGPELGFRVSSGDFIFLMDADMELDEEFLPKALEVLESTPDVAGVGGYISETHAKNLEFVARIQRQVAELSPTPVPALVLNGGGLYRREALCEAGHMSDRNLHAFEEYDLGARLRQKGWKLLRMPDHAASHYSHQLTTPALMWLRVRSGSFASYGKLMCASYEKHYIYRLLKELRAIQLSLFIITFWTSELLLSLFAPALALASSAVALPSFVVLMAVKRRSLALGTFTVLTWHLGAAGLIVGLFKPRTRPEADISYTEWNCAAGLAHAATSCEPHASFDTSYTLPKPARPILVGPQVTCTDVSEP